MLPVIEGARPDGDPGVEISIDTSKASVAAAALDAGATLVNDVTALRGDPAMAELVAERGVDCCLMHMLGEPRTMQDDPHYDDVVSDVKAFLEERMALAIKAGVAEERILLDPGIGFGKTLEHNLELLARLSRDRGARAAGRDRHLAQVVPRAADRSRGSGRADRRGRSRPTCSRTSAAPACSESTTSAPCMTRSAVTAATVSARWTPTTPKSSTT